MARVLVGYFMQANKALFHADNGNVPIASGLLQRNKNEYSDKYYGRPCV